MPHFKANKLLLIIAVLAIIGFTDASFVALKTLQGQTVPCSILEGCDVVLQSNYSHIFGVPVALIGALYYASVIVLISLLLTDRKRIIIKGVVLLAFLGSIMSVWFLFLQFFVIKAVCLYCLVSAITSFSLLGISLMAYKTIAKDDKI